MVNIFGNWRRLLSISTIILGASSSFLIPPPVISARSLQLFSAYDSFLVTIVCAMALFCFTLIGKHPYRHLVYLGTCLASIIAATACFSKYSEALEVWTFPYAGRHLVIAGEHDVLPAFRDDYNRNLHGFNKPIDPYTAFSNSENGSLEIWSKDVIMPRLRTLDNLYLILSVCTTLAIISAVHLLPNEKRAVKK